MEIFLGILIILVAIGVLLTYLRDCTFPLIIGILAVLANIAVAILSFYFALPLWVTIVAGLAVGLDIVVIIGTRNCAWWSFFLLIFAIGAWTAVAAGCFMAV